MSKQPNPSWSRERMARYMEERYGKNSGFTDSQTGRPLSWDDVTKLLDPVGVETQNESPQR